LRVCRILLVCTGNRYRSPIAERLLAARLSAASGDASGGDAAAFSVSSAGTCARPGESLNPWAAASVAEWGGRTDGFVSRRLTVEQITGADLVLGLARQHREAVVRICPTALRRCFVLEEFARLSLAAPGAVVPGAPVPLSLVGPLGAVRRAAAARGAAAPGRPEAEDVPDPEARPDQLVAACAARIARAVGVVAQALTADAVPLRRP
jgi:protein-tyrosine phosphatase